PQTPSHSLPDALPISSRWPVPPSLEPSDIIPGCRSLVLPCGAHKGEKVDDFYTARSETIPPLPWSNFPPPFLNRRQCEPSCRRCSATGWRQGACAQRSGSRAAIFRKGILSSPKRLTCVANCNIKRLLPIP